MRHAAAALLPHFGALRPDQITRQTCRAYAARRHDDGVSDGTVIKELGTLRAALRWHSPATPAVIEMPRHPPPRDRHLTREEYARLKTAAKARHIRLFIVLALTTAGRASAILDLTWDRVDFERGLIALGDGRRREKGRATVPMTGSARAALLEAQQAAVTDHVVEYGGKRVHSIKKSFARTVEAAGLVDVSPHVLRHTAAVWMAEAGVSMPEIASYLGHTNPAITARVYARFSPDYLRRAAQALE